MSTNHALLAELGVLECLLDFCAAELLATLGFHGVHKFLVLPRIDAHAVSRLLVVKHFSHPPPRSEFIQPCRLSLVRAQVRLPIGKHSRHTTTTIRLAGKATISL